MTHDYAHMHICTFERDEAMRKREVYEIMTRLFDEDEPTYTARVSKAFLEALEILKKAAEKEEAEEKKDA